MKNGHVLFTSAPSNRIPKAAPNNAASPGATSSVAWTSSYDLLDLDGGAPGPLLSSSHNYVEASSKMLFCYLEAGHMKLPHKDVLLHRRWPSEAIS